MSVSIQHLQGRTDKATVDGWPAERKANLVLEGLVGQRSVTDLCREAGISPVHYKRWRDQFIDAGCASFAYLESKNCTLEERIRQLEAENTNLRRQIQILQELCLAE